MPFLDAIPLKDIEGAEDLQEQYEALVLLDYNTLLLELNEMQVPLQDDPIAAGIQSLNGLIAQIDAQKTRAANIVSTAIRNESDIEALFKQISALYKKEYDSKLPCPPVSDFSNVAAREAACNKLLAHVKTLLTAVEGSYMRAKSFTKLTYVALGKLESTNKNISRQITVLQLANEIGEIARAGNTEKDGYTFN